MSHLPHAPRCVAVVIATGTGELAETDKCLVTNARDKPSVTLPRQAPPPDTVWVALNCNAAVASPGSPGMEPLPDRWR
jgi:hypothetical protein